MEHCTNASYHHYHKREGEGGVIEELGNGNQPWRTKATYTNKNVLNGDYVLGVPTWKRCFWTPSKCQQDEEEVAKLRRKQLLLLVGCGERRLGRGEFAKFHKKRAALERVKPWGRVHQVDEVGAEEETWSGTLIHDSVSCCWETARSDGRRENTRESIGK